MCIRDSPYIAAVATFGLNSSAYVAEIIRAGIQAVDYGQMEAGRSLGMPYSMVTVSYTHLDVYKRQLSNYYLFSSNP